MQTFTINIEDTFVNDFKAFLNTLPKNQYEIIDDSEFTEDDKKSYEKALIELRNGETTSLNQLKKELLNV